MSFDRKSLVDAVVAKGHVARIVITRVEGSSPRETGTSMLVWSDGQSGTIGGGALEWQAALAAQKRLLAGVTTPLEARIPLGPALGQCCGGAVWLLTEIFDATALSNVPETGVFARPLDTKYDTPPLAIEGLLRAARSGQPLKVTRAEGWFLEPLAPQLTPLFLYGAGHVGRALVHVLQDQPFDLTWVDTARDRFPDDIPAHAAMLVAANPADIVPHAPTEAIHIVMSYSHALDLELCHRILSRDFAHLGLIGSATKRARFQSRLRALGHAPERIARLTCPIGNKALGKHPAAIAIGVVVALLQWGAVRSVAELEGRRAGE